jgi:hypothetical protein
LLIPYLEILYKFTPFKNETWAIEFWKHNPNNQPVSPFLIRGASPKRVKSYLIQIICLMNLILLGCHRRMLTWINFLLENANSGRVSRRFYPVPTAGGSRILTPCLAKPGRLLSIFGMYLSALGFYFVIRPSNTDTTRTIVPTHNIT